MDSILTQRAKCDVLKTARGYDKINDGTQFYILNPLLCDVKTTQSEINVLCDFPFLILNGVRLNVITDNSVLLHKVNCFTKYAMFNKPHLFILTQHRFIVIQLITVTCILHVSACTQAILRHVSTKPIQRKVQ